MNAVRTHIDHFIGSNPLLASTSCTDPVKNLNNPLKQTYVKSPRIVLNLTEPNQQTIIRSRSPSPFWVKGQTTSYSEVVKSGYVSSDNSKSISPELKPIEGHKSRKSRCNLLKTPLVRARSKSPKDKWQQNDLKINKTISVSLESTFSHGSTVPSKELEDNLNIIAPNLQHVKRRSRSRRNRKTKNNFQNESVIDKEIFKTVTSENIIIEQNTNKSLSIKPEIIVSDVKNQQDSCKSVEFQNTPKPFSTVKACTQTDVLVDDLSHAISNQKLLTSEIITPLNTLDAFSKSRLSLANVSDSEYSNCCFDLNEQLKGIFGLDNRQHYNHRTFDRPRSKSDTRDLNKLTQIFTSPNTNDKYTCRFERSAESVKNNSNRDFTSGRRSFDNILSPFGNVQMGRSDGTNNENEKSVRLSVKI